jgi:hypothetical protein
MADSGRAGPSQDYPNVRLSAPLLNKQTPGPALCVGVLLRAHSRYSINVFPRPILQQSAEWAQSSETYHLISSSPATLSFWCPTNKPGIPIRGPLHLLPLYETLLLSGSQQLLNK